MGGEGRFRVAEEACRGGSPRKGLLQSAFYYCDNKGKSLFVLVYSSQPIIRESQGRNPGQEPGAGTYAEAMEEVCFLARSPWLAQVDFLVQPRTTCLGGATTQWAGSSHINRKSRECPLLPLGQSDGGDSSINVLFLPCDSRLYPVDKVRERVG